MKLNTLKPAEGSTHSPKRVGRGIGSGLGKTCGRGHKGQRARSGGYHKVGFEGGQMPLQRRIPKFGFKSAFAETYEIRLNDLEKIAGVDIIDFLILKEKKIIPHCAEDAKVILSGKIERAVVLKGIRVTAGARKSIEAAGGRVED